MYDVDGNDRVVERRDVPPFDVGAPLPHVIASEDSVVLGYLVAEPDPARAVTYPTAVGPRSDRLVATVTFKDPYVHMFGPPNDEAFAGHPLSRHGLHPYSVFEVLGSSWLRRLEQMSAVHPYHDRDYFLARNRHFIFAFHDSVFECIAKDFSVEVTRGSLQSWLRLAASGFAGAD